MQFLRGDFSGRTAVLRPPWALAEDAFISACDRCGHCIEACPTRILQRGRSGFPEVSFRTGECLFCGDCARACGPGALLRSDGRLPWSIGAVIDTQTCIAYQGVECRSCGDPCEVRAIRMSPRVGGVTVPEVDLSACSGCGACYSVCPVQAVRLQPAQTEEYP